MSTKKEQSIQDTEKSFRDMANLVLLQLNLIEKVMLSTVKNEQKDLLEEISRNEDEIDRL